MPTIKRVRAGQIAKLEGRAFEHLILSSASSRDMVILKIPDGCETKKMRQGSSWTQRIIRVKTPFDFVAFKDGKAIVFDAKSIDSQTYPRSSTLPHQLFSLKHCRSHTVDAGYLVWHRPLDMVVWYAVERLLSLTHGSSLNPSEGLHVGSGGSLSLLPIFNQPNPGP